MDALDGLALFGGILILLAIFFIVIGINELTNTKDDTIIKQPNVNTDESEKPPAESALILGFIMLVFGAGCILMWYDSRYGDNDMYM